jgi:hypothetical protein
MTKFVKFIMKKGDRKGKRYLVEKDMPCARFHHHSKVDGVSEVVLVYLASNRLPKPEKMKTRDFMNLGRLKNQWAR